MSRRARRQLAAGLLGGLALGLLLRWRRPDCEPLAGGAGLLLAGVMTAQRYQERAAAVVDTWGRDVPGSLLLYGGERATAPAGAPLVALRGVDDSYPPQRKSFLMLLHMWEQYGERYEWFLRADDDVYVRGRRLERFLRGLDSRRALFVGQAGRGLAGERLGLRPGDNFCMGGPGVLLSRETLRRVAPHLRHCLRTLRSPHEDVELGRCVAEHAGVSCTWSYDMQTIMHHNSSGAAAYNGTLKRREVHRAITLHPVKQPNNMRRLHSYLTNLHVAELRETELQVTRRLSRLKAGQRAGERAGQQTDEWGSEWAGETVPYEFISRAVYSHLRENPKRRIELPLKEALDDLIREVMDMMNAPSRERGRVIEFTELLYGYRAQHPRLGVRSILDLLLRYRRYRGRKLTAAVRRHATLVQPFSGSDIRDLSPPRPLLPGLARLWGGPDLHLLLPLSGRLPALARFLHAFRQAADRATSLTVLLHRDARGEHVQAAAAVRQLSARAHVRVQYTDGAEFSRGAALTAGLDGRDGRDLVFLIDVDVQFGAEALRAVRRHARPGRSVYFPIVLSEFSPTAVAGREYNALPGERFEPTEAAVGDVAGAHFRQYGFGLAAGGVAELRRFDLSLRGWGLEDVRLYETLLRDEGLEVVRAPAPGLRHRYHPAACEREGDAAGAGEREGEKTEDNDERKKMCLGSRASSFASEKHLLVYLLNHPEIVEKHAVT